MPVSDIHRFRLVERSGPGQRVQWRASAGIDSAAIVASGFGRAVPPATLADPQLESRGAGAWSIAAGDSSFEFEARAVDAVEMRPSLFAGLHQPFALAARERFAARCLLALLRWPGGARLLRNWHAKRSA
jgi:hypothetical protein